MPDEEGRWWPLRVRTYFITDNPDDGLVLVDIDTHKRSAQESGDARTPCAIRC